jgi:NADPH2:quinone reductase
VRAVVVDRWMEPEELRVGERPEPELMPGAVSVEVRAAGCNFFDILIAQGRYQMKPPFPFVPGAEVAGVVREVGEGVTRVRPGDRVYGTVGLGGFAEVALLSERNAYRMPEGMSFEEGAAIPTIYPTAYAALAYRTELRKGESLLVHAAAGGVGTAAVQLGKAFGARVLATAGGAEKLDVARRAGADVVIDYREEDFVARVKEETGGRGADVIYDPVGGDVFDRSLKCIAWNGRLLVIGFASGRIPEVKLNRVLLKNIALIGLHWGAYASNEPQRVTEAFEALSELYAQGWVRPVIFDRYPLERVSEALQALGSRRTYGKVVLTP